MSFTANIQIQKPWPAVQFEPNDPVHEPAGVWHEDHEVNGVMYRAANATFDDAGTKTWSLKIPAQAAYAITQNTDGSSSYLYMPPNSPSWSTGAWQGTGQPLFYHAVNYGMSPSASAAVNTAALSAAIFAAAAAGGGLVLIPPGQYNLSGTIDLDTTLSVNPFTDKSVIIAGYGSSTELIQTGTLNTFSINTVTSGIRFQDLQISYGGGGTKLNVAVYVVNSQNVTCTRVFFADCPVAMYLDQEALQSGLFDCTIEYARGPNGATAVTLAGSENYVIDCTFRQGVDGKAPDANAPTGCTAILVAPGGGGAYVTNAQIADFDTGLMFTGIGANLNHAYISNVHCESGVYAVLIQPPTNMTVYQVFFRNCVFARTHPSTSTTPGVFVDVSKGGSVSDIFFDNCMVHDWAGAGLDINGGQDIVVTGGRYGSNGSSNPTQSTTGGITVTGPAVRIVVVGADCSGSIPHYASQPPSPPPTAQPYGISVKGNVVDMQVRGCDLTGYGLGALYVANASTDLQVSDCRGYNDQQPILNGDNAPISTPLSASDCSTPYFGPSVVTFSHTSSLSVGVTGVTCQMSFGSLYLSRPTDKVQFSAQPNVFVWLGK